MILSDVVGDPLQSIASGPTVPDSSTFNDALQIFEKYDVKELIPKSVLDYLIDGQNGIVSETVKDNDHLFKKVQNRIIGNNMLCLKTIEKTAAEKGYSTLLLTDRVDGEARELAKFISGMAKSALEDGIPLKSPACIIMGGEPTVTIRGSGKGGRNQELALAVLREMRDVNKPFLFCSVGSDGTDGPTDAAGAFIDNSTINKVNNLNLNIDHYLNNNDSYHFFERTENLIKTGPTRTNVSDFIFFLY